jgi:hypothetical protein
MFNLEEIEVNPPEGKQKKNFSCAVGACVVLGERVSKCC